MGAWALPSQAQDGDAGGDRQSANQQQINGNIARGAKGFGGNEVGGAGTEDEPGPHFR